MTQLRDTIPANERDLRKSYSRIRTGLLVLMLAAGVWTLQAHAANSKSSNTTDKSKKADISKTVKANVAADIVKVHQRKAIRHQRFEMKHPETGKKVSADTMLDLPNGKKVKASEYYKHINSIEEKLNGMGHTLRDKSGKKTILQETVIDKKTLESKAKEHHARHKRFDARTMRKAPHHKELAEAHQKAIKNDSKRLDALKKLHSKVSRRDGAAPAAPASAKKTHSIKTWNYMLGNPRTLSAFVDGKLELNGSQNEVVVSGEANAGGYLMNNRIELLKGTASLRVPMTGQANTQLNLYVLGNRIFNLSQNVPTTWSKTIPLSKSIDKSVTFRFQLGPIPLSVKIGAQGTVGVNFFVGIRPLSATAQVTPNLQVRVYIQAGIDIVIASAGVGGQVTLLNESLQLGATLELQSDPSRGLYIHEHFYGLNTLEMLSGSLYVFAEVYVPAFALPPWKKQHYQWDIWGWKGFKTTGYIFNVDNKTYLSDVAKAIAGAKAAGR